MTDQVFVNIDLSQLKHPLTMGMRLRDCTVQPVETKSEAKKVKIIRKGCPIYIGLTKIEYRTDREIEFRFVDNLANQGPVQVKFSCEIREFHFSYEISRISYPYRTSGSNKK